jgi:hypothetical protein
MKNILKNNYNHTSKQILYLSFHHIFEVTVVLLNWPIKYNKSIQ